MIWPASSVPLLRASKIAGLTIAQGVIKMSWKEEHTTKIFNCEIELELEVNPAEHDVGIMQNWIEDWIITAVDGNTDEAACRYMNYKIQNEFGDEKFIEKLYDEGCGENPDYYDDFGDD